MDLFSYICVALYVQLSISNSTQMDVNIDLWQFVLVKSLDGSYSLTVSDIVHLIQEQ